QHSHGQKHRELENVVCKIRNQLVEQFKCLEQQSESRIQLLQDLQEFFRRKAEIELEYSRSLEKLAERFSSKIRSSREHQQFKKDQHLLSSVNCWYLVLNQTRRESRDHATLSDIYTNNVIVRLAQISEDVIRLFKKVSETIISPSLCATTFLLLLPKMSAAWDDTNAKQFGLKLGFAVSCGAALKVKAAFLGFLFNSVCKSMVA
uniref:F-BAR domain-containing protein n=1 Tax=Stegastes partitus TaxID=144197 RepID=A0A3B4ZRV4_9TELE